MESPTTVIYVVPSLIKSGPINVVLNILHCLSRTKFRPVVVALQRHAQTAIRGNRAEFEALGVEIIEFGYTHWQLQLHKRRIAREICRKFPTDAIFHAHGYYPTLLLSYLNDRHTVTTIHNICDEDFRMSKGQLLGRYMSLTYRHALRHISMCVPISQAMNKFYAQDPHVKLHTVLNGINISNAPIEKEEGQKLRRRLHIKDTTKVLLYPAAFNIRKNHALLIRELRKSRQEFAIIMPGSGDTLNVCKKLAKGDSRFLFPGFQTDLSIYRSISDFIISPSLSEGLPLAVLEAVVCGIPCLLSDIPPHIEIAENIFGDKAKAMLFCTKHPEQILRTVEKNLPQTFEHESIRRRALTLYSAQTMADNYTRIYESIN